METVEQLNCPEGLSEILELIAAGRLSLDEAFARLGAAPPPPALACATCQFFRPATRARPGGLCMRQPEHAEHGQSIRCYRYIQRAPHADALPIELAVKNGSRMWK